MSLTILFTHLKIILLQYFQFSVFSFSNNKLNPNGPLESVWDPLILLFSLFQLTFTFIYSTLSKKKKNQFQ